MKAFIIMLCIFLFGWSSYCQVTFNKEYQKQIGRMLKRSDVSTQTMKYFSEVAKYTYSSIDNNDKWETKYQESLRNANSNAEKFSADFQQIISKNKAKADRERIVFKTVEYTGRILISPIESIPIWGPIQKEINNQVFQAAENELTNNFKKKLKYSLDALKESNEAKYNAIIKSSNYEEVKEALNEVNFFSNQQFENIDPEYQEIIEKTQQKFLQESVNSTLQRIIDDLGNQDIRINDVDNNINKLSQFTYKFAEESNSRFKSLIENQFQLNSKLESFYDQYKDDKKALDFMQDFMYSKMNTQERISALHAGLLSNIPPSDRAMLVKQLELEAEKEKVINSARDYLNSAAISIKILGDLGLGDSKLVQDISEAVNIGQTAFSAVTAFTSGNFLSAISSITGLFGKGGDDAAIIRHKQIMQRFDRIDESLDRIEGKVDQLLLAQQEMLKLQIETYNKLYELSEKIDIQHSTEMSKLTQIEIALYENRNLIRNEWENKCQACLTAINRLRMDIDEGVLPEKAVLESEYVNLKSGELLKCEEYISTYIFRLDRPLVNPDFHLITHIDDLVSNENYRRLDTVNKLSFNLVFNYSKKIGNIKNNKDLYKSLFFPSIEISELNQKVKAETIEFGSTFYPSSPSIFANVIKPEVSERHGLVVRNIGFIQSVTDENRNLVSWEKFTSQKPPKHRNAKFNLENALRLNNVAIAQQAILAGEILLPIIFNEVYQFSSGQGDTATFKACNSLLELNEILAINFTNYAIGAYLNKNKLTQTQYSYAFNSKDTGNMERVINIKYPIVYISTTDNRIKEHKLKEGWYLTIGGKYYSLPHPSQIDKAPLVQTQYLAGLLKNRNKLLEQLFSYSAYDKNSVENLNYLIMKN